MGLAWLRRDEVPNNEHSQHELQAAFKAGELTGDFVAVVRFQGPKVNGMPELHKLTPPLTHSVQLTADRDGRPMPERAMSATNTEHGTPRSSAHHRCCKIKRIIRQ